MVAVSSTIAFMIMLVITVVLLAAGRENVANRMAEVAYFFLVTSITAAIIEIALEREESGVRDKDCKEVRLSRLYTG